MGMVIATMRGMYTFFRLICIGVLTLVAGQAVAANGDQTCPGAAFHVKGVEVSASADSGSQARALATRQALDQAMRRLTGRLLLDGQAFGSGDGDSGAGAEGLRGLQDLVDHVRILNETVLPQRYIAAFDYCFDRGKTRQYFAERGVRHAELVSAPMLVLPVWNGGGKARIWRRPNLWSDAWEEVLDNRNGLVTLRLPRSLAVERAVSGEDAAASDRGTLSRAARIEGSEKVIVTVLTPTVSGGTMTVSVTAGLYSRDGLRESEFYSLDSHSFPVDETAENMLWLAGQIEKGIERVWRSVNAYSRLEGGNAVALTIQAVEIAQWRGMVDRLRGLAPVEEVSVLQLTPRGGTVRVELSASMQSFVYALEAEGLAIDHRVDDDGAPVLALVPRSG